ncbi:hypothetical protein HGM15179_014698, partial [Zosterops borbonicus]
DSWALKQAPQGSTKSEKAQAAFGQYSQAHAVTLEDAPVQGQELDFMILTRIILAQIMSQPSLILKLNLLRLCFETQIKSLTNAVVT